MKIASALTFLGVFASSATAHFTLDYPTTRGFDEDLEPNNFCGGFSNVSLPRQPWYYRNGPIEIDSHHTSAIVNIYISFDVPTSAQSFLTTSNGTSVPPLRHDLAISGTGEFCFHANASALNIPGVNVGKGTNATIMVEYINNVHGHLYQCTDVTFTDDASVGANITCTDASTAATGTGDSGSNSSTTSGSAAAASSTAPRASTANSAVLSSLPAYILALLPAMAVVGALSLV